MSKTLDQRLMALTEAVHGHLEGILEGPGVVAWQTEGDRLHKALPGGSREPENLVGFMMDSGTSSWLAKNDPNITYKRFQALFSTLRALTLTATSKDPRVLQEIYDAVESLERVLIHL